MSGKCNELIYISVMWITASVRRTIKHWRKWVMF